MVQRKVFIDGDTRECVNIDAIESFAPVRLRAKSYDTTSV